MKVKIKAPKKYSWKTVKIKKKKPTKTIIRKKRKALV